MVLKAMEIPAGVLKAIWKESSCAPRGAGQKINQHTPSLRTQVEVTNKGIARFLLSTFASHPDIHPILIFLGFLMSPFPFSHSTCRFPKRNILPDPSFRVTSVIFSQPQVVPSPYLCSIRVHACGHILALLGITFILAKSRWSNYIRRQEIFTGVKPAQPAYSLGL